MTIVMHTTKELVRKNQTGISQQLIGAQSSTYSQSEGDLWDQYAVAYDAVAPRTSFYADYIAKVCSYVGSGEKILDIGAGTGILAQYLADKGNVVYGIDTSEQMLRQAVQKTTFSESGELHFSKQDALALQFPDASFTTVVSANVIYCVNDPQKFLQEANRVLTLGGTFVLCSVKPNNNPDDLFEQTIADMHTQSLWETHKSHIDVIVKVNSMLKEKDLMPNLFTTKQISALLHKHGFEVEAADSAFMKHNYLIVCKKVRGAL